MHTTLMKKNIYSFLLVALCTLLCGNIQAQTIIDENFDAFTEGSEDTPATTDISGYSGKLYKTISWNGKYVYEAGGKLLIKDGGNLLSKRFEGLTSTSSVRVTFDAKSPASYGGAVTVNYNYAYSGDQTVTMEDDKWHTFSVILENASSTKQLKFTPFLASDGILIDNVKVEAGTFLKAPIAYQPKTVSKTSFTATWGKVSGATAYLLDVYTKDGDEKDYLVKDQEVTETAKEVSGLEESKAYFFTVRAKVDDYTSEYSNEIAVVEVFNSVLPPKPLAATDVTKDGFTANWEAAENAVRYDIMLTRNEKLTESKEVNIIDEQFDKVVEGTLQDPEFTSTTTLDKYTSTPGWIADRNECLATGYMGIAPYGLNGSIYTPTIDLSANDGAFKMKINMGEVNYGQPSSGTPVEVRLYNENDVVEETKSVTLEEGFKDYTFEFTKGSKACYLEIYYKNLDDNTKKNNKLFMDYIQVSQQLAAGDTYSSLIEQRKLDNVTSTTFEVSLSENVSYSYALVSYAYTVVDNQLDYIESETSEAMSVSLPKEEPKDVTIDPEEGTVASLKEFKVSFLKYQFVDIAGDSYAGPATLINDETKTEITAEVKASSAELYTVKIILPEEVTAAGSYTLHIPAGKLFDGMDWDETDLPEYNFHYTIDGSVTPPVEEPETVTADPADGSTVAELDKIKVTFQTDEDVYVGNGTIEVIDDATGDVVTTATASVLGVDDAKSGYVILNDKITKSGSYVVKFASGAFVKGTLSRAEETKAFELHYTVDSTLGINNATEMDNAEVVSRVNVAGQLINSPQKGINILKLTNGKTIKLMK